MVEALFARPFTSLQIFGWMISVVMIVWTLAVIYFCIKEGDWTSLAFVTLDIIFVFLLAIIFGCNSESRKYYSDYSTLYNNLNKSIIIIEDYNKALKNATTNIMVEQGQKEVNNYNSSYNSYVEKVSYYTLNKGEDVFSEYQPITYNYEQNQFTFDDGSAIRTYNK